MNDEMADDRPQSRFFRARVSAITALTPTFRRFTFGGDDLADYGDTVLDYLDEDWTQFTFARRELTAPAPECVRTLRREMLGVPDYSNLVELPQEVSLRQAN